MKTLFIIVGILLIPVVFRIILSLLALIGFWSVGRLTGTTKRPTNKKIAN